MIYNEQRELGYSQLVALKEKYPDIIASLKRTETHDYVLMTINKNGFVKIYFGNSRCRGFIVSPDTDIDYFADKTFDTAEKAFDALLVWMCKKKYTFIKCDVPKVRDLNVCSVVRE